MKTVLRWATLALAVVFAILSSKTTAQNLPPSISDALGLFAGTKLVTGFFFPEGQKGVDPGPVQFTLVKPIVIELVTQDPTGAIIVSDRLTINTFAGAFASDNNNPSGLPPTPGAIKTGELFTPLDVHVKSDDNPTQPGSPSDVVTFLAAGNPIGAATILEDPTTPESFAFTLANPLAFDMHEPFSSIVSDKLVINEFTGTFESDANNPNGLQPVPGAFQLFTEDTSAFAVVALSDIPEPSALLLLPAGTLAFGWTLLRKRRRARLG